MKSVKAKVERMERARADGAVCWLGEGVHAADKVFCQLLLLLC